MPLVLHYVYISLIGLNKHPVTVVVFIFLNWPKEPVNLWHHTGKLRILEKIQRLLQVHIVAPILSSCDIIFELWLPSHLRCVHDFFFPSTGPSFQCMRPQHPFHHHLHSVHGDLQYPHLLPGPGPPGECRSLMLLFCFVFFQSHSVHLHTMSGCYFTKLLSSVACRLKFNKKAPRAQCCRSLALCVASCPAGSAPLSLSQPRMHHSSGRFFDQHHGLWGVCPAHSSATLLSPWVHLQLWDWCSEVL